MKLRTVKVPIDMSSEQKEIMGVVSKRQLIYVIVGGVLLYTYVPPIYKLFDIFGWLVGAMFALASAIPVVFVVVFLGFIKVGKHNMNRDYYYWIMLQRKTQYGSWRKGRKEE